MGKKILIFVVLLIAGLFVLLPSLKSETKLKIGYCPTISLYLENIDISDYDLVKLASSQQVLAELNKGTIDIAFIGRKARPEEIGQRIKTVQLFPESKTLLTSDYKEISVSELAEVNIHSVFKPEEITFDQPTFNLVTYDDFDVALEKGLNEAVLGYWKDVDYTLVDLLVVVDETGKKVDLFRSPFVYYDGRVDEKLVEKFINQVLKES